MYTINGRVRYSEIDSTNHLDLFGIINYMQDSSIFHSQDIGRGFSYLTPRNRVWLMISWQLIIKRYPKVCEEITVSTWPYDFKAFYGYRNFLIKDADGEVVAYANSLWAYYDNLNNTPVKITPEDTKGYIIEDKYPMEYAPRKISLPEVFEDREPFRVTAGDLDNNRHVNNGQYVRMAEGYIPNGFEVGELRADYRRSALLGELIRPRVNISEKVITVVLGTEDNDIYTIVSFYRKTDETV